MAIFPHYYDRVVVVAASLCASFFLVPPSSSAASPPSSDLSVPQPMLPPRRSSSSLADIEKSSSRHHRQYSILVAGSSNADTFLPVRRLPRSGENLTLLPNRHPVVDVPGGKGCNQAIACAKLSSFGGGGGGCSVELPRPRRSALVSFLGQFGNDAASSVLRHALVSNGVDISPHSGTSAIHPSGRGYVMIVPDTGEVCAVVSGGSNLQGWGRWGAGISPSSSRDGEDDDGVIGGTTTTATTTTTANDGEDAIMSDDDVREIVSSHSLLLLQCEVPQIVNLRLARAARMSSGGGVTVILDAGGEDRDMGREMLECADFLIPNETELARLAGRCRGRDNGEEGGRDDGGRDDDDDDGDGDECGWYGMSPREADEVQARIGPSPSLRTILRSVRTLQSHGASNVLVTLGSRGSILVKRRRRRREEHHHRSSSSVVSSPPSRCSMIIYQPSCPLPPGSSVVDETGAGDCYRAGFAVALLEHRRRRGGGGWGGRDDDDDEYDDDDALRCMEFASAAGALAVTRPGAVPSVPSRAEVECLLAMMMTSSDVSGSTEGKATEEEEGRRTLTTTAEVVPRGGSRDGDDGDFPFLFGSRINSMKDRIDLVDPASSPPTGPRDYLRRQASVRGLGCVDFNYPQHFEGHWTPEEAREALDEVGLVAGAVCLRYPSTFARGAMNHPDAGMRRRAIDITKRAADVARVLGCNEVVVWSAYDGYDYPFQTNYREKWDQIVSAFRECCDDYPDIKWSLEFKPTDENTRFFTVPSTGAALLLVREIDRPNMGLTLDMGHMLMAGENPGQSIAMVGGEKLFGIQLNDGYTRLAAEDGLMFGSVHPSIALEALYQLRRINFEGHLYFDTFPQRTDPVAEAEYNIRRVKEFWSAVTRMDPGEIERIAKEHDAIGALELVNEALKRQ